MSGIFGLFDIFALLYIFRSVQLSIIIWREWKNIRQEPLTPHKKSLANQASFFIAVPLSVLLHEFSHALAIWITGGQVVEFNYRVFWGYVVPAGSFTAGETWFIALAGTVGSLVFGLATWLIFRRMPASSLRYFGLRAFRFQIYFSLLYYPIFTLLGFDGDWRSIYSFTTTPFLSGATAVLHAGILFLFWRFDRQGWFEAPAFATVEEQNHFEQLKSAVDFSPDDLQLQISYIDALRRGGAKNKSSYLLNHFLSKNPHSAAAQIELAVLQSSGKGQIPKSAAEHAEKALQLGLTNPRQKAYALELIGRYQLEAGQIEKATTSFSDAIELLAKNLSDNPSQQDDIYLLERLLIVRNQAFRRQGQYELAYQDIKQARELAKETGNKAALEQAQRELETLEKHAGHIFDPKPIQIP